MRSIVLGLICCIAVVLPGLGAKSSDSDPLPDGSVWKGNSTLEAYANRDQRARPMTMTITKREQNKFAAKCIQVAVGGNRYSYEVEGIFEDGSIKWQTVRMDKGEGDGPPPAQGTLKGDSISATFEGKDKHGKPLKGTIELERETGRGKRKEK